MFLIVKYDEARCELKVISAYEDGNDCRKAFRELCLNEMVKVEAAADMKEAEKLLDEAVESKDGSWVADCAFISNNDLYVEYGSYCCRYQMVEYQEPVQPLSVTYSEDGSIRVRGRWYPIAKGKQVLEEQTQAYQTIIRALGYAGEFLETCDHKIYDKRIRDGLYQYVKERMSDIEPYFSCYFEKEQYFDSYELRFMFSRKKAEVRDRFRFSAEVLSQMPSGKLRISSENCRKDIASFIKECEETVAQRKEYIEQAEEVVLEFARVQSVLDALEAKYEGKNEAIRAYDCGLSCSSYISR